MQPSFSIIICTKNRADSLGQTLRALDAVHVPEGWRVDLLVVDNGSTDGTAALVKDIKLKNLPCEYLHEPTPGKSRALNMGMPRATSEVLVFTDDDVIPDPDWLQRLCEPILENKCEATVGKIELSPALRRPWMQPFHRHWLASPDKEQVEAQVELIGANMALHRRVLDLVPGFDVDLGPGALGFADDTLFSWQVERAGGRIRFIEEARVVHHPQASRLLRSSWLQAGRSHGRTQAYLLHHWQHEDFPNPRLRKFWVLGKLALRRRLQPQPPLDAEGGVRWEISYVGEMAMCDQFVVERERPRKYECNGSGKRATVGK